MTQEFSSAQPNQTPEEQYDSTHQPISDPSFFYQTLGHAVFNIVTSAQQQIPTQETNTTKPQPGSTPSQQKEPLPPKYIQVRTYTPAMKELYDPIATHQRELQRPLSKGDFRRGDAHPGKKPLIVASPDSRDKTIRSRFGMVGKEVRRQKMIDARIAHERDLEIYGRSAIIHKSQANLDNMTFAEKYRLRQAHRRHKADLKIAANYKKIDTAKSKPLAIIKTLPSRLVWSTYKLLFGGQ